MAATLRGYKTTAVHSHTGLHRGYLYNYLETEEIRELSTAMYVARAAMSSHSRVDIEKESKTLVNMQRGILETLPYQYSKNRLKEQERKQTEKMREVLYNEIRKKYGEEHLQRLIKEHGHAR